jgi:hypothetical protein
VLPNWDEDSPRLPANLSEVLHEIDRAAKAREMPFWETARHWQEVFLRGLYVPDQRFVALSGVNRASKTLQLEWSGGTELNLVLLLMS